MLAISSWRRAATVSISPHRTFSMCLNSMRTFCQVLLHVRRNSRLVFGLTCLIFDVVEETRNVQTTLQVNPLKYRPFARRLLHKYSSLLDHVPQGIRGNMPFLMVGSVVYWLGRRTCDSMVMSWITGRCTIDQLVLGWVTIFGRAYHLGR